MTPTSYIPQIIEAIKIAKSNGFKLPIIYNTNAYEKVETLKMLEGYIDIYLPDLKYAENDVAKEYSKIDNYFEIATKAIQEMIRQVGIPELNKKGIMQKGVMIRHLVLPSYIENSKKVLKWIKDNLDDKIYVSIMAQYFPTYKAKEYEKLQSNVVTAARRGYVDLIIEPADTRKYLVAAFEMLYTKCVCTPDKKHGTK